VNHTSLAISVNVPWGFKASVDADTVIGSVDDGLASDDNLLICPATTTALIYQPPVPSDNPNK
jgi:hypothetical protein